jgi:hypothetical protein
VHASLEDAVAALEPAPLTTLKTWVAATRTWVVDADDAARGAT